MLVTSSINQVAAGVNHTVLLTSQGKVFVTGSNQNGELGVGEATQDSNIPIALNELSFTNIIDIRAGSFSAALSSENQFYVWGKGVFGDFYTPYRVKSFNELNIRDFQISRGSSSYVLT